MSTKSFDSATYLRGLGWSGPGSSLNNSPHGRAKPVTVAQKKTLSGVGRDRDTAFPWWEMVFSSVAGKVGGVKVEHHRTSTGILSHRPPPPKANAYEELTPEEKKNRGGLNMDAMAHAKLEMARRQLYSGFLRGTVLSGSGDDKEMDEGPAKKRKRSTEEEDDSSADEAEKASGEEANRSSKRSKEERSEARRKRKEEKQAKKDAKKRDRKGKGKENLGPEDTSAKDHGAVERVVGETSETLEVSTTTTPAEVDPASSLSKSERRAAKKLRKSLATVSVGPPPSTSPSTTPVPSKDYLSPEEALAAEEQAYLEAKAAAKRAEKEERRLAKLVKKALKEKKREAAGAS
ncbi:SPOSA6832_04342, partial [Sporobolomyces salmonicolor]